MTHTITLILCDLPNARRSKETLEAQLQSLSNLRPGVELVVTPHLYDLAPNGPTVEHLQSISGDLIVLAGLYPRAAYWALAANAIEGRMGQTAFLPVEETEAPADEKQRTIWCIDLRPHADFKPVLEEIGRLIEQSTGPSVDSSQAGQGSAERVKRLDENVHHRWYPVIDYDGCRTCLECLNFCLFGVFGMDKSQQIFVEQADACRDGCPACSRVCPAHAIMFPRHDSPAVAGDPTASDDGFNLDLVQLLGSTTPGQIAAAERDKALAYARETRKDDLDRLVEDLDEMDL